MLRTLEDCRMTSYEERLKRAETFYFLEGLVNIRYVGHVVMAFWTILDGV